LITGGTIGIGFELATQLLKLNNTVIITGRDQTRLDAAREKLLSQKVGPELFYFNSNVGVHTHCGLDAVPIRIGLARRRRQRDLMVFAPATSLFEPTK